MPMSAEERKKRKHEYYLRYKERVGVKALRAADRERGRRYRIRNRDKIRERARRYRAALEYKMKRAEYMQRAYVKEKEEKRCREKARRYYWEHREEILQHSKLPEVKAKTKARMREYYQRPEVKERRASISMHVKVEKIERKCPICGKEFLPKKEMQKFCSIRCKNTFAGSCAIHPPKKGVMQKCMQCGKEFYICPCRLKSRRQTPPKYCSWECRKIGTRGASSPLWTKVERKCQVCGKKFFATPSVIRVGKGKFCSVRCRVVADTGATSSRWKQEERTCQNCGKIFSASQAELKRGGGKFCSPRCSTSYHTGKRHPTFQEKVERKCIYCGKLFSVLPARANAVYCSHKCHILHDKVERIERRCLHCGKILMVTPKRLKGGRGRFCSSACLHSSQMMKDAIAKKWADPEYRKKIIGSLGKVAKYGSKPERYAHFYISKALNGIVVTLKDWSILKNQEIDIAIPSLKVAIEYQGPLHSLPIRGEKTLREIQEADRKKGKKLKELGWKLLYIYDKKYITRVQIEKQCDEIIRQLPGFENWAPQKRLK